MSLGKDLDKRLFQFSVDVIQYLKGIEKSNHRKVITYQLLKSATSVGANYEEAQAASSRADFRNKVLIALKEMRETNYWLRLLSAINEGANKNILDELIRESEQLKKILGSIGSKVTPK